MVSRSASSQTQSGSTVVQALDINTGRTVGRIPPGKITLFRNETEEFRGILFGKAQDLVIE